VGPRAVVGVGAVSQSHDPALPLYIKQYSRFHISLNMDSKEIHGVQEQGSVKVQYSSIGIQHELNPLQWM
jgi:hypothetical protein